ncbi:MAG: hypothetical protein RMK65_09255 [Anaerolineae bacterium]|nr:hypothetical protein [Anaerolineae bacterium]MCX8068135.1 hypothetical protein [Anaerolineae bacterium]MDW7992294.1 hypothetical protein [Anaerolineae bacterium]
MEGIRKTGRGPGIRSPALALWTARLLAGIVFLFNVICALYFVAYPARYAPAFEVSGLSGELLIRGLGILFLMWNVPYVPLLLWPSRWPVLWVVILTQQIIGIAGETWMWMTLPAGHPALWSTGLRFILFDGAGLFALGAGLWLTERSRRYPSM